MPTPNTTLHFVASGSLSKHVVFILGKLRYNCSIYIPLSQQTKKAHFVRETYEKEVGARGQLLFYLVIS